MTWSIVAKDHATGRLGIVVATKFFAVGSMVPYIKSGVGAVASQAFINPFYGPRGLAMLSAGASPEDVVKLVTAADDGRDNRQVHAMDKAGRCHAFTGAKCIDWCGHTVRDGFSVAGNMLAGAAVINDTADAFAANRDLPFARRLIAAMQAGERAGGDKRGKQSAALLIHDAEDYPLLDLRVDDHTDPLAELARLETVARERWVHFRRLMPRADAPAGLIDRAELEPFIAASIAEKFE
jgi:uncharacterized Ntn-hydrolase superfamily protein